MLCGVWNGAEYQRRFDSLAESGVDVHGEATFVRAFGPKSVLDAGCGTGRVGIELARHGIEVVGADLDASMLAYAREQAPDITWVRSDLAALDLGRTFDVVVMAGNVPLFTAPGTQDALVAGVARHVGGVLVAGFSLTAGTPPRSTTSTARGPGSGSSSGSRPGTGRRSRAGTTRCPSTRATSGTRGSPPRRSPW